MATSKTTAAVSSSDGRDFRGAPHTVFLSDVHLDVKRTDITRQLVEFLQALPETTERLYIVGDLFEAWIGDDAPGPVGEHTMSVLRTISNRGVGCFFTHGNRDFLIGERFAASTGFELLDEEALIDCYGTRVLLMHGDSLCTDDTEYQKLRATLRDPQFQSHLMTLSVPQRLEMAQQLRAASATEMATKSEDIMDVNQRAVEDALRRHDVTDLLHGHTHRPGVHEFEVDGRACRRIVLGDWYEQGSVAYWSREGVELQSLARI